MSPWQRSGYVQDAAAELTGSAAPSAVDTQIKDKVSGGPTAGSRAGSREKTAKPKILAPVVQNRRLYNQGGAFLARANLHSAYLYKTTVNRFVGRIWLPIDAIVPRAKQNHKP